MTLGYVQIPQLVGPSISRKQVCFLALESGDLFELENGSGFLQLENCGQFPLKTFLIELEDSSGALALEDGSGLFELEIGP